MHPLIRFIQEECPQVAKLEKQLTEAEAVKLMNGYTMLQLQTQLMKLENYKPLLQKYRSVYLTLLKWFDMDKAKGFSTQMPSSQPKQEEQHPAESFEQSLLKVKREKFFQKYPVGSEFTSKSGTVWTVQDVDYLRNKQGGLLPIIQFIKKVSL